MPRNRFDWPYVGRELDGHWLQLLLIAWAVLALYFVVQRWDQIVTLGLPDTDDNMRLMQVRAWLNGQGWYDLRQYKMNPPYGANIHWSRLVDVPIAALILVFKPFLGTAMAERLACGIAPLLPMAVALIGLAQTVRRLVSPYAWPLVVVLLMSCTATLLMFMPDRIDHHGWQLAFLSLTLAGLADPRRAAGGLMVGLSSAASLTIGLEMLPYVLGAGAIIALQWIWDRVERPRLAAYALTLGGGTAFGYAVFASYDNAVARCDALTPVWLSVMAAAGGLLFALAWLNPGNRLVRLGLAVLAGAAIAGGFAYFFPQCTTGRLEQVSPELARNWLDNVREARPIYKHPLTMVIPIVTLPIIGLIGASLAAWTARRSERAVGWMATALFTMFAAALLLWQARAGPAAQMLAVPGATALAWIVVPWFMTARSPVMRVGGTVLAFLLISGFFVGYVVGFINRFTPIDKPDARVDLANKAGARCPWISWMRQLNRYPKGTMFTFADLGPRLITLTKFKTVIGPYHRNGDQILDVQHAFGGSPEQFRAIARRYGATYLLVCPNMAESTIYRARNPGGFYDKLAKHWLPDWLTPLPLGKGSPLALYRISYAGMDGKAAKAIGEQSLSSTK